VRVLGPPNRGPIRRSGQGRVKSNRLEEIPCHGAHAQSSGRCARQRGGVAEVQGTGSEDIRLQHGDLRTIFRSNDNDDSSALSKQSVPTKTTGPAVRG